MTRTGAPKRDEVLSFVRRSPAAVAAHDKETWIGLFAKRYVVEDPVGSRPVAGGLFDRRTGFRGNGPLERFWDTFIAPNDVAFSVDHDFVRGLTVVRDADIRTRTRSGTEVRTPAHLVYELCEEDGCLRIQRLAAHWEILPALRQLARPDPTRLGDLLRQGSRLVRMLGIGAAIGFGRAAKSVGRVGKGAVADLVAVAHGSDPAALELLDGLAPEELTKVIASVDAVSASCVTEHGPAVMVCYLDRRTNVVRQASVFVDTP